ncbi:hypothetical protein RSJ42_04115 [Methanosarcina hadiensis]|uniref:hypothetical protein n=1 Tax=Methanosarcina hadiensis TaxID=3078083 RepID=UPI0039779138
MIDEVIKSNQRDNKQSRTLIKENAMLSKENWFITGSAVVLFIVNNIFLGAFLSKMPGGSAAGITTIYVISLVSLVIRKFKSVTMVYMVYGCIGILSHLMVGDWIYIPKVAVVIIIAVIFDFFLHESSYRITSFIFGFALFVFLLNLADYGLSYLFGYFTKPVNIKDMILSLVCGYAGIICAFATYNHLQKP